jgi:hypothetical protein
MWEGDMMKKSMEMGRGGILVEVQIESLLHEIDYFRNKLGIKPNEVPSSISHSELWTINKVETVRHFYKAAVFYHQIDWLRRYHFALTEEVHRLKVLNCK